MERIEAGRKIDPETAEVDWDMALYWTLTGSGPNCRRSCGAWVDYISLALRESDVWVSFYDLPDKTREALWKKA